MLRDELNQYSISQVIGGRSAPVTRPRLSSFSNLRTVVQLLRDRPSVDVEWHFAPTDDEVIRRVFERQRKGFSVDRFLADPDLAHRFVNACHEAGLQARGADINRRLLALRKASGGGRLDPSAKPERHDGLVSRLGPGVEYALRRMQIRHGASVDDVLADLEIGKQFSSIARAISPGGRSFEYRLCALQIRKNRHVAASERSLFSKLHVAALAPLWTRIPLSDTRSADEIPREAGVIELCDADVSLFVSRADDLRKTSKQFLGGKFISRVAEHDDFWSRKPADLSLQFVARSRLPGNSSVRLWEQRLIQDQRPALNWWLDAA